MWSASNIKEGNSSHSPVLFIQTQDKIPSPLKILSASPVFHSILQDVLLQDHPDCPAAGNLRSRSGMEPTRQGERGKSPSTEIAPSIIRINEDSRLSWSSTTRSVWPSSFVTSAPTTSATTCWPTLPSATSLICLLS